jgi:patatin-like phospholipase/acyl hydrolase
MKIYYCEIESIDYIIKDAKYFPVGTFRCYLTENELSNITYDEMPYIHILRTLIAHKLHWRDMIFEMIFKRG